MRVRRNGPGKLCYGFVYRPDICNLRSNRYFVLLSADSHCFAHWRHVLAHWAMCLSSGYFSQAIAHSSQHSVQHFSMCLASGLWRAHNDAHDLQHSAQSAHNLAVRSCSCLPSAASLRQWIEHESQTIWQSAQVFAHSIKCSSCSAAINVEAKEANKPKARLVATVFKLMALPFQKVNAIAASSRNQRADIGLHYSCQPGAFSREG